MKKQIGAFAILFLSFFAFNFSFRKNNHDNRRDYRT